MWDIANLKEPTLIKPSTPVAAYSQVGQELIGLYLAEKSERVKIWNIVSGKERTVFTERNYTIQSLALSPDGQRLITTTPYGPMRVFDAISGQQLA